MRSSTSTSHTFSPTHRKIKTPSGGWWHHVPNPVYRSCVAGGLASIFVFIPSVIWFRNHTTTFNLNPEFAPGQKDYSKKDFNKREEPMPASWAKIRGIKS